MYDLRGVAWNIVLLGGPFFCDWEGLGLEFVW